MVWTMHIHVDGHSHVIQESKKKVSKWIHAYVFVCLLGSVTERESRERTFTCMQGMHSFGKEVSLITCYFQATCNNGNVSYVSGDFTCDLRYNRFT